MISDFYKKLTPLSLGDWNSDAPRETRPYYCNERVLIHPEALSYFTDVHTFAKEHDLWVNCADRSYMSLYDVLNYLSEFYVRAWTAIHIYPDHDNSFIANVLYCPPGADNISSLFVIGCIYRDGEGWSLHS